MKSSLRIASLRLVCIAAIGLATGIAACPVNPPSGVQYPESRPGAQGKKPVNHTVVISGMEFHPDTLYIHKGDTITWDNRDIVAHCVTEFPSKKWTSSLLYPGHSWKKVVNRSCDYYCAVHVVMKGKIIVK
jgi:plastocyanin